MKTATHSLQRRQLYEEVWSTPMTKLAEKYGLSDVGLAKICRNQNIPCPHRGYWTKLAAGKQPTQTPLPDPDNDRTIDIKSSQLPETTLAEHQNLLAQAKGGEAKSENKIVVADTLRGAHPLVVQARKHFEQTETDEHSIYYQHNNESLRLRVGKESLHRALRIMDAILKALEERGYPVDPGPTATVVDIPIKFSISERTKTVRVEGKGADLEGHYNFHHSRFSNRRQPGGKLSVTIDDLYPANGIRKSWGDGTKQSLEDVLNSFVTGLVTAAVAVKEFRIARELDEEEQRAAERLQELIRQAQAEERSSIDALLQEAEDWNQSVLLRDYIEANRQAYAALHGEIAKDSDFAIWETWAKAKADQLDPLQAQDLTNKE